MKKFAESKVANSDNKDEIEKSLLHELKKYFDTVYGENVMPVVKMQKLFLIPRFKKFAEIHAEEVKSGWRILPEWCEKKFNIKLVLKYSDVDVNDDDPQENEIEIDEEDVKKTRCKEVSMCVDGSDVPELSENEVCVDFSLRVDRVDYNESTNEYRIIDYKTGDSAGDPKDKFVSSKWKDLQLPLYKAIIEKYLRKEKGPEITVSIAYLTMPRDDENVGIKPLYDPIKSDIALDKAVKIGLFQAGEAILDIIDKKFWPPTIVSWEDDFSNLIGDREYE